MSDVPDVLFRSFQPADAEALPNLFMRAIRVVYPEISDGWTNDLENVEAYYLNGGAMLVGTSNEEIVAMGGLHRVDEKIGEMKRVAVEPLQQGRGLGQALLTTLEIRAKVLDIKKIVLDTTADQEAARHLYEKNDYSQVDRKMVAHPSGLLFDTFFYEKDLL